jgi:hypothetical protein
VKANIGLINTSYHASSIGSRSLAGGSITTGTGTGTGDDGEGSTYSSQEQSQLQLTNSMDGSSSRLSPGSASRGAMAAGFVFMDDESVLTEEGGGGGGAAGGGGNRSRGGTGNKSSAGSMGAAVAGGGSGAPGGVDTMPRAPVLPYIPNRLKNCFIDGRKGMRRKKKRTGRADLLHGEEDTQDGVGSGGGDQSSAMSPKGSEFGGGSMDSVVMGLLAATRGVTSPGGGGSLSPYNGRTSANNSRYGGNTHHNHPRSGTNTPLLPPIKLGSGSAFASPISSARQQQQLVAFSPAPSSRGGNGGFYSSAPSSSRGGGGGAGGGSNRFVTSPSGSGNYNYNNGSRPQSSSAPSTPGQKLRMALQNQQVAALQSREDLYARLGVADDEASASSHGRSVMSPTGSAAAASSPAKMANASASKRLAMAMQDHYAPILGTLKETEHAVIMYR